MQSAPAVSFPVGRSHFQGWTFLFAALAGAVCGVLWWTESQLCGWRQGLFAFSYLATVSFAIVMWLRAPQGVLRWDGQTWTWTSLRASFCAELSVHLDLQLGLLLCLDSGIGPRSWLWAERRMSKLQWNDLRRAVFAKHSSMRMQGEYPEIPMKQEMS